MWQFKNLLVVELKTILTYMRFHLSDEFYCIKSATEWHENMMLTRVYFTQNWLHDKQIVIGTRENKTSEIADSAL